MASSKNESAHQEEDNGKPLNLELIASAIENNKLGLKVHKIIADTVMDSPHHRSVEFYLVPLAGMISAGMFRKEPTTVTDVLNNLYFQLYWDAEPSHIFPEFRVEARQDSDGFNPGKIVYHDRIPADVKKQIVYSSGVLLLDVQDSVEKNESFGLPISKIGLRVGTSVTIYPKTKLAEMALEGATPLELQAANKRYA